MTTALVTGANRGIGFSLCRQLAARGHPVIAVCRTPSEPLQQLAGTRVESGVDVTTDDAMTALAARLRGTRIDVLIANAGILREEPYPMIAGRGMPESQCAQRAAPRDRNACRATMQRMYIDA